MSAPPTTLPPPPNDLAGAPWAPLAEEDSARQTITPVQQRLFLLCALLLVFLGVFWGFPRAANAVNEAVLAFYCVILIHRCGVLIAGLSHTGFLRPRTGGLRGIPEDEDESCALSPPAGFEQCPGDDQPEQAASRGRITIDRGELDDAVLPYISVLVPLYKEASVLAQIAGALARLKYPADRYEVLLLLEEDDTETREAYEATTLPSHFRAVIVPPGIPRTKPRACNYGVEQCRGEIIVIFDAEDQPEHDQFMRAVEVLRNSSENVACVQARLAFYNSRQNLLTRWFSAEYMSWFEIMLPGLFAAGAPIPLGGTSNYFRRKALQDVGGWDAWNVTEDCDLGIRLYRRGYRVAILDSATWEEACPRVPMWIRQRSRWVKGYMQTWLVHTRHPGQLWRELGAWRFLNMQLTVGGSAVCLVLNPVYWLLTLLWWLHPTALEHSMMAGPTLVLGNLSCTVGNSLFVLFHCAGPLRRKHWDLALIGLLVPFYWLLMSIAAWKALIQLVTAPHHWEKTSHGLAQMPPADPLPEPRATV